RDGRDIVRVRQRWAGWPAGGRFPDPGGPIEAGRGEVAAVGSERDLSNECGMTNACHPYAPGRQVHETDVVGVIGPLKPIVPPIRPEDRTRPARAELGIPDVVRAFRLPCEVGGRQRGPAVGTGGPPGAPVAHLTPKPGAREPP